MGLFSNLVVSAFVEVEREVRIRGAKLFWCATYAFSVLDTRRCGTSAKWELLVVRDVDSAVLANSSRSRYRCAGGKDHINSTVPV